MKTVFRYRVEKPGSGRSQTGEVRTDSERVARQVLAMNYPKRYGWKIVELVETTPEPIRYRPF